MPPKRQQQARTERVIVIGAGIGGLATAGWLTAAGVECLVLERAATVGGKLRTVEIDGQPIDCGPTVFTMRWVFEELFAQLGATLQEELPMQPLQVLARHAWDANGPFDLTSDAELNEAGIAAFAGPTEARRYREFGARAQRLCEALREPFLRGERPTPTSLMLRMGLSGVPALLGGSPFATLWQELGRHFHDPRLRQLFGRYATYCGASPFEAPATLMLLAHVEQEGVWRIEGGMQRLATQLAARLAARGAVLRCGAEVSRILVERGRVCGVELVGGERLAAAAVIHNGDAAALARGLVGAEARRAVDLLPPGERSLSALTWSMRARTAGFPLARHNVFFAPDSAGEFAALFEARRMPATPTVYVCAQDRGDDAEPAPRAAERLFCLVNAPARGDDAPLTAEEIDTCWTRTMERLAACGLSLVPASPPVATTPTDFARRYPGTGGALYGRASHGWRATFERPASRSRLPGLYLAGGSVHPGPGVPTAALSGRLAALSVLQDLGRQPPATLQRGSASRPRSAPVATPGGTSTP